MQQQYWDHLYLTKKVYHQTLEPVCEKYQITRMELDILLFLANNLQFDTAKDIIEHRGLTKSHVSISIQSLEKKGYLKRVSYPENHKNLHLSLLESSKIIIEDGRQAQQDLFKKLFAHLEEEHFHYLKETLSQITKNAYQILEEK